MNKPLVYIIILNYCSADDSIECVKTIEKINYEKYKILIIDNNSPDNSKEILSKFLPEKKILFLKKNTGYAEGNNIGIRIALNDGADYVFIVNPDIRLPSDCIKNYVEVFEKNENIGALNPIQLNNNKGEIDNRFYKYVLSRYCTFNELSSPKYNQLWDVHTLYGASLMLSRQALEKVGGFDPLYFAYGEEQDLCRRIRYFGFRLIVTSKSPVIHLRTHENKGIDDFRLFLRLKGGYLCDLKNINAPFDRIIKSTFKEFFHDFKNKNTTFRYKKVHYMRVVIWLMTNIHKIYKHRELEKRGNAHL